MSICLDGLTFDEIQSICKDTFEIGGVYQYTGHNTLFPVYPELHSNFITLKNNFVFTVIDILPIHSLGIENAYVKILTEFGRCYFPIFDSIPTNKIKHLI